MTHFTALHSAHATASGAARDAARENADDSAADNAHDSTHRNTHRNTHDSTRDDTPAHSTLPGTAAPTDTERRLIALIESELMLPPQAIHAGTPIAHLGDSLDWLELLMAVEDVFGVELDPARTKSVGTVADLLRLLDPQAGEGLLGEVQASVQQALQSMAAPRPV